MIFKFHNLVFLIKNNNRRVKYSTKILSGKIYFIFYYVLFFIKKYMNINKNC